MFVCYVVLIAFAMPPATSSVIRNLASNSTCRASEFSCLDGTCIRAGAVCDTHWDCPDGSDELLCYSSSISNLTEGTVSHERYKRQTPCEGQKCSDGTCLAVEHRCDGVTHCSDGSDEHPALCLRGMFSCLDGELISITLHCDGNADCDDGSDENGVCTEVECGKGAFRCAYGACIERSLTCNEQVDCVDGSDETPELCIKKIPAHSTLATTTMATVSGKCVLPPYPEHGTYVAINSPSTTPGQGLEYAQLNVSCEYGYGVVGDAAPYCLDGTWFIPIQKQKCVPFCRLEPDVSVNYYCKVLGTNGYRVCNLLEPSGTLVKPECNAPNYGSSEPLRTMTCDDNGRWNRYVTCKPECGRVTTTAEKLIWGATDAIRGELPWHVAIYKKPTQKKNYYEHICGGSIISNSVVITAAHCFAMSDPASYAVATAKQYREWDNEEDKDVQKSEIKSIELSPYYQGVSANYQHDIAVLILETPFVYYTYVRPVCLNFEVNFNKEQLQPGNLGKVAGWGLTGANAPASPVLKVAQLPVVSIEECIRITPQNFTENITGDKICAGYNNGTAAVCKGDSGGGLTFPATERGRTRYYLRGIVSTAPRGSNECNVNTVTTFTQIYTHRDYINEFL